MLPIADLTPSRRTFIATAAASGALSGAAIALGLQGFGLMGTPSRADIQGQVLASGRDELVLPPQLFGGDEPPARNAIEAFLADAPQRPKRLRLLPDRYTLSAPIVLKDTVDVTVFLDGSTITITTPPNPSPTRGWPGFVYAVGGSNLTIRGAGIIDYNPLPYTQGTCMAVNGTASFDIKIDPGHRTDLTNSDAHFGFDDAGLPDTGRNNIPNTITPVSPGVIRLNQYKGVTYAIGKRYVVMHRKYGGNIVTAQRVNGLRLLGDLRCYASPGMGIWSSGCSDQEVSGFRLGLKTASGRLISANADGIHSESGRGRFYVKDSIVQNCCDDCVTVHTRTFPIDSITGQTLTFRAQRPPHWRAGDTLEIIDADGSSLGSTTLQSLTHDGPTYTVALGGLLPAAINMNRQIVSTSALPNDIQIHQNTFGDNYGRGIIVSSAYPSIRQNRISGTSWQAIQGRVYFSFFSEGIPPRSAKIFVNEISGCVRTPARGDTYASIMFYNRMQSGAFSEGCPIINPMVAGNLIRDCDVGAICIMQSIRPSIMGNFVENVCRKPMTGDDRDGSRYAISLMNVTDPAIAGNVDATRSGIIAALDSSPITNAILSLNPGFTSRRIKQQKTELHLCP